MSSKWYVGIRADNHIYQTFKCTPEHAVESRLGDTYAAVIGPFRTMRGAFYMAKHGGNGNPRLACVSDAERYASR